MVSIKDPFSFLCFSISPQHEPALHPPFFVLFCEPMPSVFLFYENVFISSKPLPLKEFTFIFPLYLGYIVCAVFAVFELQIRNVLYKSIKVSNPVIWTAPFPQ